MMKKQILVLSFVISTITIHAQIASSHCGEVQSLFIENQIVNSPKNLVHQHKNKHQQKFFCLHSKSVITKHSKELEILNAANYYGSVANEHLCLNLPQSCNYKISTIQGEELLEGTVQEEAIHIGRLPQGVYLLEAWSLGEH